VVREILDTFDLIRADLVLVEQKLRAGSDEMFAPLAQGMLTLLDSGGKRLRPALALLASRFHTPPALIGPVVSLAAAVETLHTATLVHDDLIDGAVFRRGRKTLNASWTGATTVLAGDYLFARAARFAAETQSTRVVTIFSETLMTICDGELRQLFGAYDLQQDLDSYYRRIFSKTASLFTASTEAAAVLSGADEDTVLALREYGKNLGMSFQIQDDVLDFTGDQNLMGKPTGSDLRQGIVTLPVYYYLQDNPRQDEWIEALNRENTDRDRVVDELVVEIRQSSAIERCRAEADSLARRAQDVLIPLPDIEEKRRLNDLVSSLLDRQY
jgi:geranylgeranyl pyrophosphate synthase